MDDFTEEYDELDDAPCCSICDGVGHGYPGGGPCPLENRGAWDSFRDEEAEREALMAFGPEGF